ncbi:hypothetical protein Hdeb2414_s0001g00013071 [Helianthus debilis subsp. tardiflorus]
MQAQKASRRIFVLNFLLFYNTLLVETTTNSSINMRFLPALRRGMEIRSFNWCEYMIRCLDRTVEAWSPNDYFFGPMPLLVAALIGDQKKFREDEPRSINIIENITQDDIKSLSIKLDMVRFEQVLENEKGLHPIQRYPFEKRKMTKKQLVQNMSRRLNKRFKQVKGKMIRKLYPK